MLCLATCFIPKFRVDLDDIHSYTPVIQFQREKIINMISTVKGKLNQNRLAQNLHKVFLNTFPKEKFIQSHGELSKFMIFTAEYHNIAYEELVYLVVLYDYACFSAIVRDENDDLYLARNFDYFFKNEIKGLMADIDFYQDGELQYSAIQLVGLGAFMNVIRPGSYCLSLNQRMDTGLTDIIENYSKGYLAAVFSLNIVTEKAITFEESVLEMQKIQLADSVYLITVGTNDDQGAIFEKGPESLTYLPLTSSLVVANEDITDYSPNRKFAEQYLSSIHSVTSESLMKMLRTDPLNNFKTIYSLVCKVATGEYVIIG